VAIGNENTAVMTAAEANRRFYQVYALDYERTEGCVFGALQQQRFLAALDRALKHLGPKPAVLDACGGSGNAAGALTARGVLPVLVDVSPDMVDLWRAKATQMGIDPETHVVAIESFLAEDPRSWDLITFCSALHHLEDYEAVLDLAVRRLAEGGVIFIMFDSTRATPLTRALRRWDWALHLLFTQPAEFVRLGKRALTRRSPEHDADAYVGRLAERHANDGIDDIALRRRLESSGMRTLVHDRYVEARLAPIRVLLRQMRRASHFHLLVQKRSSRPSEPGS
jgi:ubiquinone/menaquinone biosynthesis C-methylase UbiE